MSDMETAGKMSSDVRIGLEMSRQGGQRVLGMRASAEIQHVGSHVGRAARNWLSNGLGEVVDDVKSSLRNSVGEGRRTRITVDFVYRGVLRPKTVCLKQCVAGRVGEKARGSPRPVQSERGATGQG